MLISVRELSELFGVKPRGVLHVGAHEAEEAQDYADFGWGPTVWVEMLPEKAEALRAKFEADPANTVIHAACWDADGELLPIFRADNAQSSSLLKPDLHLISHPAVTFAEGGEIRTSRLATILPKDAPIEFINFDIQGAELRALKGLGARLAEVKWAYLEVNERQLYEGCAQLEEIDSFLKEHDFERISKRMAGSTGWGDAFYMLVAHRSFG
jgi:FkbM family methyltransferase